MTRANDECNRRPPTTPSLGDRRPNRPTGRLAAPLTVLASWNHLLSDSRDFRVATTVATNPDEVVRVMSEHRRVRLVHVMYSRSSSRTEMPSIDASIAADCISSSASRCLSSAMSGETPARRRRVRGRVPCPRRRASPRPTEVVATPRSVLGSPESMTARSSARDVRLASLSANSASWPPPVRGCGRRRAGGGCRLGSRTFPIHPRGIYGLGLKMYLRHDVLCSSCASSCFCSVISVATTRARLSPDAISIGTMSVWTVCELPSASTNPSSSMWTAHRTQWPLHRRFAARCSSESANRMGSVLTPLDGDAVGRCRGLVCERVSAVGVLHKYLLRDGVDYLPQSFPLSVRSL